MLLIQKILWKNVLNKNNSKSYQQIETNKEISLLPRQMGMRFFLVSLSIVSMLALSFFVISLMICSAWWVCLNLREVFLLRVCDESSWSTVRPSRSYLRKSWVAEWVLWRSVLISVCFLVDYYPCVSKVCPWPWDCLSSQIFPCLYAWLSLLIRFVFQVIGVILNVRFLLINFCELATMLLNKLLLLP